MNKVAVAAGALGVAAAAAWALAPAAAGAERPRCEDAVGKTLAASAQVRVFVAPRTAHGGYSTAITACAPGSRRIVRLAVGKRTVKLAQVAVNGPWVAAIESNYSTVKGHDEGVAFNEAVVINVNTGRQKGSLVLTGLEVTDTAVSADGVVAVFARPFGKKQRRAAFLAHVADRYWSTQGTGPSSAGQAAPMVAA